MTTTLDALTTTHAPALKTSAEAERLQVQALVQQFEGMLLTEMLKDVRAGEDDDAAFGLGGSTMTDMTQGEFGMALSRQGGFGLGDMLAETLLRKAKDGASAAEILQAAGVAAPGAPLTPREPATTPAIDPTGLASPSVLPAAVPTGDRTADILAASVPVTSAYGWRHDPFTGESKFHRGVDLAAVYGSEVRSFGPGVVQSAGERPGYGLTVVVAHGGGRETLYAHLSSIDVAPGEPVEAGQRIARSGNSGRATGAHLHFEAREFGQPVDAGRLAATWNGRLSDTGVGESDE